MSLFLFSAPDTMPNPDPFVIETFALPCLGRMYVANGQTLTAVGAWPAANRAFFLPFVLSGQHSYTRAFWANGAVAGNVDIGVYTEAGSRLWAAGSTAMAGANDLQVATISPTLTLAPGNYYLAVAASDVVTATFMRGVPNADSLRAAGQMKQDTALPLPASATFAALTDSFVPWCGIAELASF